MHKNEWAKPNREVRLVWDGISEADFGEFESDDSIVGRKKVNFEREDEVEEKRKGPFRRRESFKRC